MLTLNTTPTPAAAEDTFCEVEYAALCDTMAATYIGGDLVTAVQTTVTNAYMTRRERWVKEADHYLARFGISLAGPAPMAINR